MGGVSIYLGGLGPIEGIREKVVAYELPVRAATTREVVKARNGRYVPGELKGVMLKDAKGKPIAIKLPKSKGVYELRLGSGILPLTGYGETCYWTEVSLLKEKKGAKKTDEEEDRYQVIHRVGASFWRAAGVDEGESWSETDRVTSAYFKTEDPGPYYVKVLADQCKNSKDNPLKDTKMTLAVYKDVIMNRWLLYAAVALAVIGILAMFSTASDD